MHASQFQGCVVEQRVEKKRKIVHSAMSEAGWQGQIPMTVGYVSFIAISFVFTIYCCIMYIHNMYVHIM